MAIHFACVCGRGFSVRERRAGRTTTCPDCGQEVRVPRLGAPAAPDPGGVQRLAAVLAEYALWPGVVGGSFALMAAATRRGYNMEIAVIAVYVPLLGCLTLAETGLAFRRAWHWRDGQVWRNLLHTALGTFVTLFFSAVFIVGLVFPVSKHLSATLGFRPWPYAWPLWIQVALMVLAWDFFAYWTHRWSHEWGWLWRVHALHHSPPRVHAINAGRVHPLDTLKTEIIGLPVLVLLGAPLKVLVWYLAFFRFIGVLSHCNLPLRLGPLTYIFNTPVLHRWHHSVRPEEGLKNYGQNLMIWDQVFGTYYHPPDRAPDRLGIGDPMPDGFFAQLLSPFTLGRLRARRTAERKVTAPAASHA